MNAVEIEAAVSELAAATFDPKEFPFAFLAAFGNKETTLAKLRKGVSNASDVPGGVLQRNNIHVAVAPKGEVEGILTALRSSPQTVQGKAKFIFATDGEWFEAQDLVSGEPLADEYQNLANHFGFFLPLAGISTIKEIKDNPIDVRATGRLNKLYIELLKENPDWAKAERRPELNHFLARLIFCFFAEDTDIFQGNGGLFTKTVDQMTERDGSNTHLVLEQIFRAMNVSISDRDSADLPAYAGPFPYVNGGLFSGSAETPRFSKIARSYLLRAGELNWKKINPDIFGSMIQAVSDDVERGSLGMHYTSVPNILKVLNPLFLDDLREQLDRAGDHKASLLKLRERMSRIRVFDPACGSGNFLVIAYKEMRAIEAEINRRRNEIDRASDVHLTNFRGIEIRDFAAEVARLALIIAEFQCDVLYRGPKLALAEFLPLNNENWIVCGNALRLDWPTICPPNGTGVNIFSTSNDLFDTLLDQPMIDFQNEGGETYICGNPPYLGSKLQSSDQKTDLQISAGSLVNDWKSLDLICGWFVKASQFASGSNCRIAFVTTNSICQGLHVPILWPKLCELGIHIAFCHDSFKWTNLASHVAGVTVIILGLDSESPAEKKIYSLTQDGKLQVRSVQNINAYLVNFRDIYVEPVSAPRHIGAQMMFGNMPRDEGYLLFKYRDEMDAFLSKDHRGRKFLRKYVGSEEAIEGRHRWCLWITDAERSEAEEISTVQERLNLVTNARMKMKAPSTRAFASRPHRFVQIQGYASRQAIVVPTHTSESREFLPVALFAQDAIISNAAFAIYDASLWNLAVIASRLHLVWIASVCGKLETRYRYSNTLGWNTFPIPPLTEQDRAELTQCAEEILLARERHFPKTIADLYDPEEMPNDLRYAHERNDETLERIYIGRRFKNDTERLERLFEMYAKLMTAEGGKIKSKSLRRKHEQ